MSTLEIRFAHLDVISYFFCPKGFHLWGYVFFFFFFFAYSNFLGSFGLLGYGFFEVWVLGPPVCKHALYS